MYTHVIHIRDSSFFNPGLPGGFDSRQVFGLAANPGMIDVVSFLASPKVEIHRRPVVEFRVVNTHRTNPALHLWQGPVGSPHIVVLGHGDVFHRRPQPEPLGKKVPVLLGVVFPLSVFLLDFCVQVGKIRKGRVRHRPVCRVVHLLLVF